MTTDPMSAPADARSAWPIAVASIGPFEETLTDIRRDPAGTTDAATAELTNGSTGDALFILRAVGAHATARLVAPLLRVALVIRYTHIVRELLGGLRYKDAERLVPPEVWRLLDEADDDDAYRRMGELLEHLGLFDALDELLRRADDHSDPDVRAVVDDFAGL